MPGAQPSPANSPADPPVKGFNLLIVAQKGRLQYEALLLAASLRHFAGNNAVRLFVAEPQPGPLWADDPRMDHWRIRKMLTAFGAHFIPLHNQAFGDSYPNGNKIEALLQMPPAEPFLFLDTDTLITGDLTRVGFDFARPSASSRVAPTWPVISLYGPGYEKIWRALYDHFALDYDSSLNTAYPPEFWRRYAYFNAGWFYGPCPRLFGQRMLDYAREVRRADLPVLECQPLRPWLDQIVLPLVIHAMGGTRDLVPVGRMDGDTTCHYRALPMLYALAGDHTLGVLETLAAQPEMHRVLCQHPPFNRMLYNGHGAQARALFDRTGPEPTLAEAQARLSRAGLWAR